jgi:DNA-binding transcriptional regulator YhcF (GntR family)
MDLIPLDPGASEPPYEQLRRQIAARAASGSLPSGTRLPTVRALAAELDLAVNTVAKTYRALETDGVVVTEGRRGTFVAPGAVAGGAEAGAAAAEYVAVARRLGLGLTEATLLVERSWSPR